MYTRIRASVVLTILLVSTLSLTAVAMPVAASVPVGAEYEITVTEDGDVDAVTLLLTADEETYGAWELRASIEGYESIGEFFGSTLIEEEPAIGEYTADERDIDGGYESEIQFSDIDLEKSENMSVTKTDGTLRWESTGVEERDDDALFEEVSYRVVMPDDVTDSNAHEVSAETASWDIHEEHPGTLFVEAAVDGASTADDGDETADSDDGDDSDKSDDGDATSDDSDTTGDDDSLPGVGIVAGLAGLLGAVLVLARRSN